MAAYQRENKREEARLAAQDRRNERRERIEQVIREREQQKIDLVNKKLTRKEENDFYRAIMAYGVETNTKTGKKNWDRFKVVYKFHEFFFRLEIPPISSLFLRIEFVFSSQSQKIPFQVSRHFWKTF